MAVVVVLVGASCVCVCSTSWCDVSKDLRIESGDGVAAVAAACEFAKTIVMSPERFTICHTDESATLCACVIRDMRSPAPATGR